MAIRKSEFQELFFSKDIKNTMKLCENALKAGGFKNIKKNNIINQLNGEIKKITLVGEIKITLLPQDQGTKLSIDCMANVDNIYALFKSPGRAILEKFTENLK